MLLCYDEKLSVKTSYKTQNGGSLMSWHIKKFNELSVEELYKILALRSEVFVVEQACPYLDCDGKDMKSYHLFCERDGEVVANVRIIEKGISYEEVSLGRVIVRKDNRGTGIAREMLQKAIEFVHAHLGERAIKIQAQAYLLDFYKSLGFKPVSGEYLENNIPHVEMLYTR